MCQMYKIPQGSPVECMFLFLPRKDALSPPKTDYFRALNYYKCQILPLLPSEKGLGVR